jgi:hypothetical protein
MSLRPLILNREIASLNETLLPCWKALRNFEKVRGVPLLSQPITDIAGCCACARAGHTTGKVVGVGPQKSDGRIAPEQVRSTIVLTDTLVAFKVPIKLQTPLLRERN